MFKVDERWIVSSSDYVAQMECDTKTSLDLALAAGLLVVDRRPEDDAMLALTKKYGDLHEQNVLAQLRSQGRLVVEVEQAPRRDSQSLQAAAERTATALRGGADVVYQAVFFDGSFYGIADFVMRVDDGAGTPRYEVYDTKLARSVKPGAVIQLAAYSEQLAIAGFPLPASLHVWLGDGDVRSFQVAQVLPYLRKIRDDLFQKLESPAIPDPLWGQAVPACARCNWDNLCQSGRKQARDLSLVAGISSGQRRKLANADVTTIDELAELKDAGTEAPPIDISPDTLTRLAAQAALQVLTSPLGAAGTETSGVNRNVVFDVFAPSELAAIPIPSHGDVFFDMEGDPFLNDGVGLEYLFGAVTHTEGFKAFWAHSQVEEKQAFEQFVDWVQQRRRTWPDLHVYHYAAYEQTALKRLAQRHGTREDVVDDWLRAGLFCDLYPVVTRSLRTSQPSYSIKYLEPLYEINRQDDGVDNAADSVAQYEQYLKYQLLLSKQEQDSVREGYAKKSAGILEEIRAYNEVDCDSLVGLVTWLRGCAEEHGIQSNLTPTQSLVEQSEPRPTAELSKQLLIGVDPDPANRDEEQNARALTAAALDFHWREQKSTWWEHFTRLDAELADLDGDDNVLVIRDAEVSDWAKKSERAKLTARRITFSVEPEEIVPFGEADKAFVYYDDPPEDLPTGRERGRGWQEVTVLEISDSAVTIDEQPSGTVARFSNAPIALAPGQPIRTVALARAIERFATDYLEKGSAASNAALDILRRTPPRLSSGADALPQRSDSTSSVVAALSDLSDSYLAVQGPPGTGKTYVGSRAIKELVGRGWRIGVVAQSHKVVENLLREVIVSGLSADLVAKEGKTAREWTAVKDLRQWMDEQPGGFVVGGTAWTFCRAAILDGPPLDLMVIDEAGQFSLANTVAVSLAAQRLLLLGDPQQLPQVSQGTHPEPVDESALGHLLNGADTIPEKFGYFLATTRRMHDNVCEPISHLSYRGELTSDDVTRSRNLAGVVPGIERHLVDHEGCKVHSPEEVAEVLRLVEDCLGRAWTDGDESGPLGQEGILVVAPYNRQVAAIRYALDQRGFTNVVVGTVDKLQGQQAPVVIVSLTASSAREIPRGINFLLLRNRLNVAVSRAQWVCHLVYSPRLLDGAVSSVDDLQRLGGLLLLSEGPAVTGGGA